jgi:predicted porin
MKKSLIALAVLAASGAAMAQSSVTLYGIVDTYLSSEKTETAAKNGGANTSLTQNKLSSGGVNTSRWGLKGTEDLGGGLKANFDLQQGFNVDDGAARSVDATNNNLDAKGNTILDNNGKYIKYTVDNNGKYVVDAKGKYVVDAKGIRVKYTQTPAAFARQAWVGISGGFGAVRLGKTSTPYYDIDSLQAAMFDVVFAPQRRVFASSYNGYTNFTGNTIYYQAPNMSGFSGAVSYSLNENKAATFEAGYVTSLNLTYAGGPISASFGFQNEKVTDNAQAVTFVRLGGAYDFGVAVAKVTYGRVSDGRYAGGVITPLAGNETTEWQVGVDVPISSALILSASFAKSDENTFVGGNNATGRTGGGAAAKYILSKRTFAYVGIEADRATDPAKNDATNTTIAAGIQHRF